MPLDHDLTLKIQILIVDSDPKDISEFISDLMGDWNVIAIASNSVDALEKITAAIPDIIISEIDLPGMDGLELCAVLKTSPDFSQIPFVFYTHEMESMVRAKALKAGADFILDKKLPIAEVIKDIRSILKEEDERKREPNTGAFTGALEQMNLIELIQSMDMNKKTGRLTLESHRLKGDIYFNRGKIVDAVTKNLVGEQAVYRMLSWAQGTFKFYANILSPQNRVKMFGQSLILEGLRRVDEQRRLLNELPELNKIFKPAFALSHIIQNINLSPHEEKILIKFRQGNPLQTIIERNDIGDLETIAAISKLLSQKLVIQSDKDEQKSNAKITIAHDRESNSPKLRTSDGFFGTIDLTDEEESD